MGKDLDYPLQVENGGHLCETGKLVPDGPGGDGGEVRHQRPELFVELQPSELRKEKDGGKRKDGKRWMSRGGGGGGRKKKDSRETQPAENRMLLGHCRPFCAH